MSHTTKWALMLVAGMFITASAIADDKPFTDAEFVKKAAIGGMHEVELGKIATAQGVSDGVKKFGQKMVDDHSKANDAL